MINVEFTDEQHSFVRDACQKLRDREELPDLSDADAITHICREWLAGKRLPVVAAPAQPAAKPEGKKGNVEDDETPEVAEKPVTQKGEIWILGDHRVACGSCTDMDLLTRLMQQDPVKMTFTSPPYNAGKSQKLCRSKQETIADNKYREYDDDQAPEDYLKLLVDFTSKALSFSQFAVVNIQQLSGNKVAFIDYLTAFRDRIHDIAIWDKLHAQPAMATAVMNSRFEYLIFFGTEHGSKRPIPGATFRGTVDNVYAAPKQGRNEFSEIHAATFPVHLPEWGITNFTQPGDIVFDPFGGTGTTLIAAEKHGRKARTMDLDALYVDVIVKRWQSFTGLNATSATDGRSFNEIAIERSV